jgi:hypothetical protein
MPTHKQNFLKKHNLPPDTSLSLAEVSKLTKIPVSILQEVYNRGIGAWVSSSPSQIRMKGTFQKGGTAPKSARLPKEAWAMARVYSFIQKGTTYKTTDSDLAKKS